MRWDQTMIIILNYQNGVNQRFMSIWSMEYSLVSAWQCKIYITVKFSFSKICLSISKILYLLQDFFHILLYVKINYSMQHINFSPCFEINSQYIICLLLNMEEKINLLLSKWDDFSATNGFQYVWDWRGPLPSFQ